MMVDPANLVSSTNSALRYVANAQWWPADVMHCQQFELLKPLIAHAYRTVPWYHEQFDRLGLAPEAIVTEQTWRELPVLTRVDVQSAGDSLHSSQPPASHGRVRPNWTSGSTASPLMVLKTDVTTRLWIANTLREYDWQVGDLSKKLAVIRSLPAGTAHGSGAVLPSWGTAAAGRVQTGPCVVMDVRSSTAEQCEWLKSVEADYLQTYPSVLFELAKFCVTNKVRFSRLKQVFTFGEVLESRVREMCRIAWDVEILDSYSSAEVGYVAAQCSRRDAYHVCAEHLLVEVLDDEGRECGPREVGRIVVTDLFNYAMPLLRYEIGDYAESGEPCPCGRKLPTLKRVLGRQRNLFVLPNGQKRWPVLEMDALDVFQSGLPIRQYQVIQRSLTLIDVNLVVANPLLPNEEAGLRSVLAKWLCEGLEFRFNYVDHIPRGPSGKYEDFRCELRDDETIAGNT